MCPTTITTFGIHKSSCEDRLHITKSSKHESWFPFRLISPSYRRTVWWRCTLPKKRKNSPRFPPPHTHLKSHRTSRIMEFLTIPTVSIPVRLLFGPDRWKSGRTCSTAKTQPLASYLPVMSLQPVAVGGERIGVVRRSWIMVAEFISWRTFSII